MKLKLFAIFSLFLALNSVCMGSDSDRPFAHHELSIASERRSHVERATMALVLAQERSREHVRDESQIEQAALDRPYAHHELVDRGPNSNAQEEDNQMQTSTHKEREHVRDNKKFNCTHKGCGYTTNHKFSLKTHERTHTGEKPFQCSQCKYATNNNPNLIRHERTHTGEKPFQCNYNGCGYATAHKSDLERHALTHTGEKPFQCNYPGCDYAAALKSHIKKHERTHTGKKPFQCNYPGCDYAAAQKSHIKKHERTHTGEKPFQCNYPGCDYAAAQKANLKTHERTHTGEKPFQCNYPGCDYAAALKSSLKIHERTHTGEKPFQCNYPGCDYAAALKSSLKIHERTHTGEKPFQCNYPGCDYAAAQKSHLKKHVMTHTRKTRIQAEPREHIREQDIPPVAQQFTTLQQTTSPEPLTFDKTDFTSSYMQPSGPSVHDISFFGEYKCQEPFCVFFTNDQNELLEHLAIAHDILINPNIGFELDPEELIQAIPEESPIFQCNEPGCGFTTINQMLLDTHMRREHS